jgi:hypothetical protein
VVEIRLEECHGYAQVDLVSLWAYLRLAFFLSAMALRQQIFPRCIQACISRLCSAGERRVFFLLWPVTMHEHLDHSQSIQNGGIIYAVD